jgi:hypothetical protein
VSGPRLQALDMALEGGNVDAIARALRELNGSADPDVLGRALELVRDPTPPVAAHALLVLVCSGRPLPDGLEARLRERLAREVLLRAAVARGLLYSDDGRAWDLMARLMDQPLFLESAVTEIAGQPTRRHAAWVAAGRRGLETLPLQQASREKLERLLRKLESRPRPRKQTGADQKPGP